MFRSFYSLLFLMLFSQVSMAQVVVISHKDHNGIQSLSPILPKADTQTQRSNKSVIVMKEVNCRPKDLHSFDWLAQFLVQKSFVTPDFTILMIVPINPKHVVVIGKGKSYGYFEILIPAEES